MIKEIKETYKIFVKNHNLPTTEFIEVENLKPLAQVNCNDLYNRKYVMYYRKDFEKYNQAYINSILYHEFTHILDSIAILNAEKINYEDFETIMDIFSEIHASAEEMNVLFFSESIEPTLNKNIMHKEIISLKSFLDQTLGHVNNILQEEVPNEKILYYFIGYIDFLRRIDIKYDYRYNTGSKELDKLANDLTLLVFNIPDRRCVTKEFIDYHKKITTIMNKKLNDMQDLLSSLKDLI